MVWSVVSSSNCLSASRCSHGCIRVFLPFDSSQRDASNVHLSHVQCSTKRFDSMVFGLSKTVTNYAILTAIKRRMTTTEEHC